MNFSESVKQVLLGKIQEMAACPGPFVHFQSNPGDKGLSNEICIILYA